MFTRRDVCTLTGFNENQFKALARREQLVFGTTETPSSEGDFERHWNRFSAFDVLLVAIQNSLMLRSGYADGLKPETARDIVANNSGAIARLLEESLKSDQWIGYVGQPINRYCYDGGFHVYGSLTDVAEKVTAHCVDATDPSSRRLFERDPAALRVYLINVSEVLRTVRARATDHEIHFPEKP